MALPLEQYGFIGDCQSGALVGSNGAIDWLCLPRFDSPACFAALLGTPEHGRWQLSPAGDGWSARQRYRGETMILETEFSSPAGAVRIIDFMSLRSTVADVVRIVEGVRGTVEMQMHLTLRSDYGVVVPWVVGTGNGLRAIAGPDQWRLRTSVPLVNEQFETRARFTVAQGQRVHFDLTWSESHLDEPEGLECDRALDDTERFWTGWVSRCIHDGPWRDAVVRSALTLKALTYAPTGGIVAAPTTSLPEHLGGVRNWDYRYCWLRDATFTLLALMRAGYAQEAQAWREWLVRAAAGKPSQVQIMYGIAGERRLAEYELPHLPGYEGSRPVRIGNRAHEQFQLDVFGEVMDALHQAWKHGLEDNESGWRIERAIVEFLESNWNRPDYGIWEVRGPARHFTHSKVMAWVGLDRAIKSADHLGFDGPVERWKALRGQVHAEICEKGFDPDLGSFVQSYGSKELDASLLMMALVGFLPPGDPRNVGTVEAIQRHLANGAFVSRYQARPDVDGLPPGEGAFLLCSFWLVDNLALMGRRDAACVLYDRILEARSQTGLLSESYDVDARRLVGNYPQAFSHVGLINTAINLTESAGPAEERRRS
jgi:GH15 family glucan-1,4-alpha-glucosidase